MVLKPIIYEIIVFMVGFYPGSIKKNLYIATTVSGETLPCLNFLVSHSDTIYIYSRTDYMRNIKVHITITGQVYCPVYKTLQKLPTWG
jgi:hypothetical protein